MKKRDREFVEYSESEGSTVEVGVSEIAENKAELQWSLVQ